jgi:hypothetical protein
VFGWGVGWLAAAFTYSNQHLVVVDPEISVSHPKSRAFPTQAADAQREHYLKQLTISEALQCRLLSSHMAWHGKARVQRPQKNRNSQKNESTSERLNESTYLSGRIQIARPSAC